MGRFSDIAKDLTVASGLLWAGAALPAAEPPTGGNQTSNAQEPVQQKAWTPALVYKEIGAVEARIGTIDQFFKNHPDQKVEAGTWIKKRAEVERFSQEAESLMEKAPSANMQQILGSGLSAVNSSLSLYIDHLATVSDVKTTAPAGTPARPVFNDAIIGTYDVGEMEGLKASASILHALMRARHTKDGTTPDATQKMIIESLSQIESAQNPRDLAEKMRPAATALITGLANQEGAGANGLREALQKMLKPGASASMSGKAAAEKHAAADDTIGWKGAWQDKVDSSRQLHRFAREANSFRALIQEEGGLTLVKKNAGNLAEHIKAQKEGAGNTELIKHLSEIAVAKDANTVLKLPFSPLETLRKATDLYQATSETPSDKDSSGKTSTKKLPN